MANLSGVNETELIYSAYADSDKVISLWRMAIAKATDLGVDDGDPFPPGLKSGLDVASLRTWIDSVIRPDDMEHESIKAERNRQLGLLARYVATVRTKIPAA